MSIVLNTKIIFQFTRFNYIEDISLQLWKIYDKQQQNILLVFPIFPFEEIDR